MDMYNALGFGSVGMLIGMLVMSVICVLMWKQKRIEYAHNITGTIWVLTTKVRDYTTGKLLYVLQSTENGEEEIFSEAQLMEYFHEMKR